MAHRPDFPEFKALAQRHTVVPVYRRLLGDTITPVQAFANLADGPWSFLFESVIGGEKVGRYSFLGADPFLTFQAFGHRVTLEGSESTTYDCADPLKRLGELVAEFTSPSLPGLPRFMGGAVGYVAYDAIRYSERLPNAPTDDRQLPDLAFGFYDRMVIFDHISKEMIVVALARISNDDGGLDKADNATAAYARACARIDDWVNLLESQSRRIPLADIDFADEKLAEYRSNFTQDQFEAAIETCKEYIRAGDFFQIVISQRWEKPTTAEPFEIYRTLRVVNPSPFMVYLKTPPATLVASSPEIMVRVENGVVTNRPLAGTRRRGATETQDRQLAAELLADPKERAEHIMLVDLGRNDVGRVCELASIQLSDLMTVERYSHVMHITSNVHGRLNEGLSAVDALRACLPAGTVSGAPKVRAMEVIDEVEPHRRGPYAGAIGYLDFTGNLDTCIALRTMVFCRGNVYVQAGAGIVFDSDPAAEYQETRNKARGMFKAIGITEARLDSGSPTPRSSAPW